MTNRIGRTSIVRQSRRSRPSRGPPIPLESVQWYGKHSDYVVFDEGMKPSVLFLLALSPLLQAGDIGSRVLYAGGTVPGVRNKSGLRIELLQDDAIKLVTRDSSFLIPYKDVNTLEYGLRISRRYVEAVLISPIFLVAKKKTHFLTIGYTDQDGKQQAMVLQVGKEEIRPLLVSLEARTGRRVEYQDEEARKAGKG